MKTPFPVRHPGRRVAAGLALCALMAACGSGGLAELLVKLITARFERSEVTLARGTTQRVALQVTCDLEGLNTPFGRLDVQVRFDPSRLLPPGLQVVPVGQDPDSEGWRTYPCEDPHPDPSLRAATIDIEVSAGAESTLTDETLLAVVRIEPLRPVDAPKDTTTAELVVRREPHRQPRVRGADRHRHPAHRAGLLAGRRPPHADRRERCRAARRRVHAEVHRHRRHRQHQHAGQPAVADRGPARPD
jgi:hypothetical protein